MISQNKKKTKRPPQPLPIIGLTFLLVSVSVVFAPNDFCSTLETTELSFTIINLLTRKLVTNKNGQKRKFPFLIVKPISSTRVVWGSSSLLPFRCPETYLYILVINVNKKNTQTNPGVMTPIQINVIFWTSKLFTCTI